MKDRDRLPVGKIDLLEQYKTSNRGLVAIVTEQEAQLAATQAKLDKAIAALTRVSESLGIEGVLASQCLAEISAKGDGK